jgi:hypothetical protein
MADVIVLTDPDFVFDLGDTYPNCNHHEDGPGMAPLAEAGSRLFIADLRPNKELHLISMVTGLALDDGQWRGKWHPSPVVDITPLASKLGALGKPRVLSKEAAAALVALLAPVQPEKPAAAKKKPAKKLIFRSALKPKRLSDLTPLQKKQIAKLDWIDVDKEIKNVQFFAIQDKGKLVYELAIHAGDDGVVFRAGTTRAVASFSQGGISECDSDDLEEALEAGYDAVK